MNMTLKQLRDHHFDGYVGGGPSAAFHKLAVDLLDAFTDGEQVVGDGVSWISRTSLPRVNPAQMVRIAQNYARVDAEHAYTKVPNFVPHDWVVAAMCAAYDAGRQNIIDGTHTNGYTPEAIESVRRIFDPRPAVATAGDGVTDETRKLAEEGLWYFERVGDAGDRKYVEAIRACMASPSAVAGVPDVRLPDEIGLSLCAPISIEWMAKRAGHREGWNACLAKVRELNGLAAAPESGGM